MDRLLFKIVLWMTMLAAAMFAMALITMSWAAQASFLCKTLETKEYVDVVSVGNNRVLVQISGGNFLDGSAEFEDPVLYIKVPVDNGIVLIAYNVREQIAVTVAKVGNKQQIHEMVCAFR